LSLGPNEGCPSVPCTSTIGGSYDLVTTQLIAMWGSFPGLSLTHWCLFRSWKCTAREDRCETGSKTNPTQFCWCALQLKRFIFGPN